MVQCFQVLDFNLNLRRYSAGPYLNLFVNRARVFKLAVGAVVAMAGRYCLTPG
jgi:hypothetical protein